MTRIHASDAARQRAWRERHAKTPEGREFLRRRRWSQELRRAIKVSIRQITKEIL